MNCAICLKEIDINKAVLTPCDHRFCSVCFFKWIYLKKTCPLCRRILIAEANTEEKEELDYLLELSQQEISYINRLREKIEEKQDKIQELNSELELLEQIKTERKNEIDKLGAKRHELNRVAGPRQQEQPWAARGGVRGRQNGQRMWGRGRRRMGMMWA